ncbi:irregular chiasm C-roughest protein [Caerostris extrusa]|uniref:Irregular chiasm C-roughest protein n=1 Tax=Caerostris extrusa TaxID=172846 RepID=A0AAV4RSZ4_CAEEX|nr:irregular chiasm C-roughest protein [Caerostris extrusa]
MGRSGTPRKYPLHQEKNPQIKKRGSEGGEIAREINVPLSVCHSVFHHFSPKIVQGDFLRTTAGMTVELTCESHAGKPKAELTWLDGEGNVVTDDIEYTTQLLGDDKRANAALKWTLTPRREHDGKTFTCRSENPALTQPLHARISLEVKYPPEITLKVSSDKIMEHDNVKFTCEAVANPGDVNIKWQRNDEVIVGDHSTTYTITRVTREYNKDTISCEVSNAVGTTKSTHTLNVLYGPVFRSTIENVAADIGSEVTLSCDVDGNPKPDTVWTFEGSDAVLSTQSKLVIPSTDAGQSWQVHLQSHSGGIC